MDYDGTTKVARDFFATIQNKLVYAVTRRTAAELIVERADPRTPNMGLTSWAGSRVRKADVTVSKNYLNAAEIEELNRLTTMYLDFDLFDADRRALDAAEADRDATEDLAAIEAEMRRLTRDEDA